MRMRGYMDGSWSHADYILRGENCPPDEVAAHLDDIRRSLEAELLIHFATDHRHVLKSLTWAISPNAELAVTLCDILRTADYLDQNVKLNATAAGLTRRTGGKTAALLTHGQTRTLVEELDKMVLHAPSPMGGPSIRDRPWMGVVLTHTGRAGLSPREGEVSSVLLISGRENRSPLEKYRASFEELGVRLRATVEAGARRDFVVMGLVKHHLRSPTPSTTLSHVAEDALDLAIHITGATGGAVYLLKTHERTYFQREAQRGDLSLPYPSEFDYSEGNTVGWSCINHKAYQDIPGSSVSAGTSHVLDSFDGIELVTPISGPLAHTGTAAVGAVVLHRDAPEPFGFYERSLVRNICLRLSLLRTNITTRKIASAISTLRAGSPRRLQLANGGQNTGSSVDPTSRSTLGPPFPRDIALAVERFAVPFEQLAEATQSHSVTLRIALPTQSAHAIGGLVLVRVAAYPSGRLNDDHAVIGRYGPGSHWDVMRWGREEYVPDVSKDSRWRECRPNTRSSLCVPVKVEGVLVGTIHMESPLPGNYLPVLPLVLALSGAVGRTLADARGELEGEVLDRAAHALARRHEYSGTLRSLRESISALTDGARGTIERDVENLESVVKDLREPPRTPPLSQVVSVYSLIEQLARQTRMRLSYEEPEDQLFQLPILDAAIPPMSTLITNLLRNINYHSQRAAYDYAGKPIPRVIFSTTELDGDQQLVLVLENLAKEAMDEEALGALYRYPVEDPNGRLRLGTYIAGLNARRIGGRLHAVALNNGQLFRSTLVLPRTILRGSFS